MSASGVEKEYPVPKAEPLKVLKNINLDIHAGEIVAIVGESGAGKSTLLHILGGLDRPSRGDVTIDDHTLSDLDDFQLANLRNQSIGFVFQFHHLLPEFNALENVAMPGLIQRKSRKDSFDRAKSLLVEVGLTQRMTHKPRELSGGEQQRVAFARALMNEPLIVLADEPSGNLDLKNSQSLHQMMWRLVRETKITFVVVTHNRELADRADHIIELVDGYIQNS
ncbi:ABC transporter ATP-binding protein [candidate division KSB1 bacterium]|nr:ABC transporter ATP-binding protein [candidate division KSB1 bacterium]